MTWWEMKRTIDTLVKSHKLNGNKVNIHYINILYPSLINPMDMEIDTSNNNELRIKTIKDSN